MVWFGKFPRSESRFLMQKEAQEKFAERLGFLIIFILHGVVFTVYSEKINSNDNPRHCEELKH